MDKLYWHPSTIVIPEEHSWFRLYHVVFRRNVLATANFMDFIGQLKDGWLEAEFKNAYEAEDGLIVSDATENKLWDHSYRNPDNFDSSLDPSVLKKLPYDEALDLLLEHGFISRGNKFSYELSKKGMMDRFKGNFYEQIGTECLLNRKMPVDWWVEQKFESDFENTRPTPYRYVQDLFLEQYFEENMKQASVMEIGCGTGYYSRKISKHVERMVGIDYNSDYVDIAKTKWKAADYPNLEFMVGDIIHVEGLLNQVEDNKFDSVVMIDTFLFLFDQGYQPELYENRHKIVKNMANLLKPDGKMLIMDPHPLWLTPWFGNPEAPFGIISEYQDRRFKVIPSLEEMTQFLFDGGLRIRRILEPNIDEEYRNIDETAYAFMKQVPQWWFFELEKAR